MRILARLVLALLLVLSIASPGLARMAVIETRVSLQDQSEHSIRTAVNGAVEIAVRGAMAMGLPWILVTQALLEDQTVIVEIIASDTKREGGKRVEPGPAEPPRLESSM